MLTFDYKAQLSQLYSQRSKPVITLPEETRLTLLDPNTGFVLDAFTAGGYMNPTEGDSLAQPTEGKQESREYVVVRHRSATPEWLDGRYDPTL
jgi:hypothetical protein